MSFSSLEKGNETWKCISDVSKWRARVNGKLFFFVFTWMAFIWVDEVWMITRWRSQAIAPIQNEDMTMGKSWAALKNLQRISVCFPNGHLPATIDQKVTGQVKLQSKKSEKDKAKIKELRGSQRSWRSLRRAQSKQRLRVEPIIMTGM